MPSSIEDLLAAELMACPVCTAPRLVPGSDERLPEFLLCSECDAVFPIENGTPSLIDLQALIRLPLDLLAAWHLTQQRALPHYEANDRASCSTVERDDVRQFQRFMNLSGKHVLDIGSGSFALPGYADGTTYYADGQGWAQFIGLDPIPPSKPPDFPLVVATGERLPFRDGSLDSVILATSLDHALDVSTTLGEIYRVLSGHGEIFFWGMFVEDENLTGRGVEVPVLARSTASEPKAADPVGMYLAAKQSFDNLAARVDADATRFEQSLVDEFHFRHFSRDALLRALARRRFVVAEEETYKSEGGDSHSFLRVIKGSPEQLVAKELELAMAPSSRAAVQHALSESLVPAIADIKDEIAAARGELTQLADLVTTLAEARSAPRFAVRPRRAARRALIGTHHLTKMSWPLLRTRFRGHRSTAGGRRILMLTISQIECDPRINKVAKSLAERGYQVDIMAPSDSPTPYEVEVIPGVRYVMTPRDPRWKLSLIYQQEFRRAAASREFDYVHANDLTTLAMGAVLARERGVPLVYDAHELWAENVEFDGVDWIPMKPRTKRFAKRWERWFLRYVDLLVTVGPSIRDEYQRRYELSDRPLLLANYPSLELLDIPVSRSLREECGLGPEVFVTLYMGGVNPLRNIETVIRAHKLLPEDHVFIVMGPGIEHYSERYEALAREEGVATRVYFLPPVEMSEVVGAARDADCGIVMLRNICQNFYWFFPNKLFEYALAGLPVAASAFPDVTAFIDGERCGVTFDPESPESIAAALAGLASERGQAREMGERGLASIVRERNWEVVVKELVDAYASLRR